MFKLHKKYWKQLSFIGKLEYIKDEIKSKFYPYLTIRKIKDLWWEIKNIPFTIKKIWFFIPVLWKYQWYDQSFLLELWSRSLAYNIKFYSDSSNIMMLESRRKLIVRKMTQLSAIFNRLALDDYPDLYPIKYKSIILKNSPIIKNGRIWAYKCNPMSSVKKNELVIKNIRNKEKLIKKDLKTIWQILNKYLLTWWD